LNGAHSLFQLQRRPRFRSIQDSYLRAGAKLRCAKAGRQLIKLSFLRQRSFLAKFRRKHFAFGGSGHAVASRRPRYDDRHSFHEALEWPLPAAKPILNARPARSAEQEANRGVSGNCQNPSRTRIITKSRQAPLMKRVLCIIN
jgi:hypothetical protein